MNPRHMAALAQMFGNDDTDDEPTLPPEAEAETLVALLADLHADRPPFKVGDLVTQKAAPMKVYRFPALGHPAIVTEVLPAAVAEAGRGTQRMMVDIVIAVVTNGSAGPKFAEYSVDSRRFELWTPGA